MTPHQTSPPPPPSTNLPPPPPPLSHLPPHTPSSSSSSPPQSDATKNGENNHGFPNQQMQIVRPIPDIDDQLETKDYDGFLDLGFMPPAVIPTIPLNVIYPDITLRGRILKELIVTLILVMINLILERGRLPSQGELITLKLEVLLLMILQHPSFLEKEAYFLSE
ncbi:unnamed protein product [Lactuca saligna]|uniref:Uncharacterized protein n=1 Tax=Lactuca saligna TaxID=75948 RepID=A0AA36ENK9_LACSI|nr:unnamed protein product [Lactuca saligna]